MDFNILLIPVNALALVVILAALYHLLRPHATPFPTLPGTQWHDLLTTRETLPLYVAVHRVNRTIMSLSRKYGDVFQIWLVGSREVVTKDPADIVHVLADVDDFERGIAMRFVLGAVLPGSLFTLPKDVHRASRRMLRGSFGPRQLPAFHEAMVRAVREAVDTITDASRSGVGAGVVSGFPGNVVDITAVLSTLTIRVITAVAFGVDMPLEARVDFSRNVDVLIEELMKEYILYPFRQLAAPFGSRNRFFETRSRVFAVCNGFIARRLAQRADNTAHSESSGGDLLDAILDLHSSKKSADVATSTAIAADTAMFAVAGAHTTMSTVSWAVYELSLPENAPVLAILVDEVDAVVQEHAHGDSGDDGGEAGVVLPLAAVANLVYVQKVWRETLRLHPISSAIGRRATRDVTLRGSGVTVPRGTVVHALFLGSQTDARHHPKPQCFDPSRWGTPDAPGAADLAPAGTFMPFSAGQANCAGRFFADHEGVLILAELYRRFRFKLACDREYIRSCSGWVEVARFDVDDSGHSHVGVPVRVQLRS